MVFNVNNYTVDLALEDDFQSWLRQLPAVVQEAAKTVTNDEQRHFRQGLWTSFCQSENGLPVHAEKLSGTIETLAIASGLVPATFKPRAMSLSDVAMAKAQAYSSQYLYGDVVATIMTADLPQSEKSALFHTAQSFWLANEDRLQLNFNQRVGVADYLKDAKARSGALGAMTCRLATVASGTSDSAVTDLISTIGETLGTIEQILTSVNQSHDSLDFRTMIMSGNYPLSLLFALEEESDWFKLSLTPPPNRLQVNLKLPESSQFKLANNRQFS